MTDAAIRIYVYAVVALVVKQLVLAWHGALVRSRHHAYLNAEDARTFGGTVVTEEAPAVQRVLRASRNDVENLPLYFVIGALAVAVNVSTSVLAWSSGVFVLARTVFSVAYVAAIQPVRTVAYVVATLALLALVVATVARVV